MIKSSLVYGVRIELQQLLQEIPSFQLDFPIRIEQEYSTFIADVQKLVVQKNKNQIPKTFQIKYKRRKWEIELALFFIADLNGKIEFYFGKELGQTDLYDEAKIQEIQPLKMQQMKVIQQVFTRYHQDTPKLLLVETLS